MIKINDNFATHSIYEKEVEEASTIEEVNNINWK